MGSSNAFSIAMWEDGSPEITWLGAPQRIEIPTDYDFSLEYVLNRFGQTFEDFVSDSNVVIGIDAPLGFPIEYKRLVSGGCGPNRKIPREIDNPLAYRTTERWVHEKFKKKALSAPFDKLGNNATLAISTVQRWRSQYGFAALPFDDDNGNRVIIEVYPRLLESKAFDGVRNSVYGRIPANVRQQTDEYDACIAALNSLSLRTNLAHIPLPSVFLPPKEHIEAAKSEGWIYSFTTT